MGGILDPNKYIRIVPTFNENEVDQFFQHFEKIAENLNWPSELWPVLVQTVLKGKAQDVYSSLSKEDCADYETLKYAILNAYELVPEAYRQKFRNLKRIYGHVELMLNLLMKKRYFLRNGVTQNQ